jgi:hypothetical protein
MFWYICPKVWCPYCYIPIKYSRIKQIFTRTTRKGKDCPTAKCPFGDHDVIIRYKKRSSSGEMIDDDNLYPGFAKPKHPEGFCLPCCFKKP